MADPPGEMSRRIVCRKHRHCPNGRLPGPTFRPHWHCPVGGNTCAATMRLLCPDEFKIVCGGVSLTYVTATHGFQSPTRHR